MANQLRSGGGTHRVQKHDTLWGISLKHYGTGLHWKEIKKANAGKVSSENYLLVGLDLTIPFMQLPTAQSNNTFFGPPKPAHLSSQNFTKPAEADKPALLLLKPAFKFKPITLPSLEGKLIEFSPLKFSTEHTTCTIHYTMTLDGTASFEPTVCAASAHISITGKVDEQAIKSVLVAEMGKVFGQGKVSLSSEINPNGEIKLIDEDGCLKTDMLKVTFEIDDKNKWTFKPMPAMCSIRSLKFSAFSAEKSHTFMLRGGAVKLVTNGTWNIEMLIDFKSPIPKGLSIPQVSQYALIVFAAALTVKALVVFPAALPATLIGVISYSEALKMFPYLKN